jgi:predicted ATP-dependent serine protease
MATAPNTPKPNTIEDSDPQIKAFDMWKEECYRNKEHYLNWGTTKLNEALRGTKGGMSVLIGGQPNFGKSQLLTNIISNILINNEDVIVIDYSLDDPRNKRLTQYIASSAKLDMNTVDFINTVTDKAKLDRFDEACSRFKKWLESNKLYIFESSSDESTVNQASIKFIVDKTEEIRKRHPTSKLIVAIDSLNDIEVSIRSDDPYVRSEASAKELNRLIVRTNSVLLASTHIRKNGGRRPTLEDLKGNNFLAYSAKVAIGVHNDIKLNKKKAQVFWIGKRPDGTTVDMPILEAHFLKSKVSDFNGAIVFKQWPAQARLEEPEDQSSYIDMIYGKV